jgi:hypothetical protein
MKIKTASYIKYNNINSTIEVVLENNHKIYVPLDEANTDYQAIQEWISEGNTVIDNPPE